MVASIAPSQSLIRVHGRGRLLSILEKEVLLTRLHVVRDGRFVAEMMNWSSYWKPLLDLRCNELEGSLDALHSGWCGYIRSGFDLRMTRELCFRYFALLDVLLSSRRESDASHPWVVALQTVLGFECFGITPNVSRSEVLGAATCSLRNPCYLLAKLKMPNALDDPQFLPLVTVSGTAKPEAFYHYRQYPLSPDSPTSLLLYPAVAEAKRSASFRLINSLISGVSDAIDPWTRERSLRLWRCIILPIIQARKAVEFCMIPLEFVDVGAGSGSLISSLCRQIQALGTSMGVIPRFRVWFVDLETGDPTRFFRSRRMRKLADSLMFLGNDYRSWLSRPQPLPKNAGLRIALVSKLLNNLSCFAVRRISPEELPLTLGEKTVLSDGDIHLPTRCLAPGGEGVEALAISSSRVPLREGRAFAHISLSEFYRGLYWLLSSRNPAEALDNAIFLPVRTFNPDCLTTLDGKSVIALLAENCDYVVIEDADLRPKDVVEHMTEFSLRSLSIQDVTQAMGLTGNYAYVLWSKTGTQSPDLGGEQIW